MEAASLSLDRSGNPGAGLLEVIPRPFLGREELGEPGPERFFSSDFRGFSSLENAPNFSVSAETGALFTDLHFKAVALDGTSRIVKGVGLIPVYLDGTYRVGGDWWVGLGGGGAFSSDVSQWGGGPEVIWRFSASHSFSPSKPPETQHFLTAGVWWEDMEVTKSGFGSFKSTIAPQVGYRFRTPLGGEGGWAFQIDLRYEYAPFRYSEPVLSGDRQMNGHGLLLGFGLAVVF